MVDGFLNLDKPRGLTSHDVVARVRRLTGVRRVGHAGTLDPMATGVLLVCVGRATRVSQYLMAGRKIYRAQVRLGITTDTYDAEGQVVARDPVTPDRDRVEAALERFLGVMDQVPPVYSAVKREGTPLHRLVRRGVAIDRSSLKARRVETFRLTVTNWTSPEFTLEVICSPGTYVRALAHDLGQALGCGAHLVGLARLGSGRFLLEHAVTLEALAHASAAGRWSELLHPLDEALTHFPALRLDADASYRLCSGQAVRPSPPLAQADRENLLAEATEAGLARAYGPGGTFLALVTYDAAADLWVPQKVFADVDHLRPTPER